MSRFIAQTKTSCITLDLDALYSSNADLIFRGADGATDVTIRVPPPGAGVEGELSYLFQTRRQAIVIDSLNSLYHLMSTEDGSSKSRRLAFAVASLSFFARANAKAVVMTMYRRERLSRPGTGKSISGLSDATVSVSLEGDELAITTERGRTWVGGGFLTRIP